MQALVDVQVQGVDDTVTVEVRVDIVIGVTHARAVALLVPPPTSPGERIGGGHFPAQTKYRGAQIQGARGETIQGT